MVEDREQHGLEDDCLGEGRFDDEQRAPGEVGVPLAVAQDVPREAVCSQPVDGRLADDPARTASEWSSSKRKDSRASRARPVPATTPYRLPPESRRPKTSNTLRRSAVPERSAACSIVSSYWSVSKPVENTIQGSRAGCPGRSLGDNGDVTASPEAATVERTDVDEVVQLELPWITIVWDDPVNLMSYVTFVFTDYFRYSKSKAQKLMMQVHTEGKAVVSSGSREEMERDVQAMHSYGLWATLEKSDA